MNSSPIAPDRRLASIDSFRALTMVLMIFVNDLWSLNGIPEWLGHTAAEVDGMGLADWVFPGFLFIVGLSIPFAIRARLRKGDSKIRVFRHILIRSIALWVMGLFMVNLEMSSNEAMLISKPIWQILMIFGFMLVWNSYRDDKWMGIPDWILQIVGVGILIGLAASYRSGSGDDLHWMQLHWWGILGLIGWGYFLCATAYLLIGNSIVGIGLVALGFFGMNALEFLPVVFQPSVVVGAANYGSVIVGVWMSVLLIRQQGEQNGNNRWVLWTIVLAVGLLIYGFATRPIWGISKIYGTPSWVAICSAISLFSFLILYWLCDRKGITGWVKSIAPAGRSTLTCYLVPYWVYAVIILTGFQWPGLLSTGVVGILKSILFALLVVQFTRLLEFAKVRVRI